MYLVYACPRCRRARVVEDGRKQAACASCSRPLRLADLRPMHRAETLDEAREAIGLVNARLRRREDEYAASLAPRPAPRAAHDDAYAHAAADARGARGEPARVDALARALSRDLGAWTEDDLARAFAAAGIDVARVERHLARMVETRVLVEPRPGRFRSQDF